MPKKQNIDDIPNSLIIAIIDEWIKNERDRCILKRRFIDGLTFDALAEEFDLSYQSIKNICHKQGDRVLMKCQFSLKND